MVAGARETGSTSAAIGLKAELSRLDTCAMHRDKLSEAELNRIVGIFIRLNGVKCSFYSLSLPPMSSRICNLLLLEPSLVLEIVTLIKNILSVVQ